jgi:hypothetical protein
MHFLEIENVEIIEDVSAITAAEEEDKVTNKGGGVAGTGIWLRARRRHGSPRHCFDIKRMHVIEHAGAVSASKDIY